MKITEAQLRAQCDKDELFYKKIIDRGYVSYHFNSFEKLILFKDFSYRDSINIFVAIKKGKSYLYTHEILSVNMRDFCTITAIRVKSMGYESLPVFYCISEFDNTLNFFPRGETLKNIEYILVKKDETKN